MSVLVFGGTGFDTVVPVAGLPILAADSVPPAAPIRDYVSHTGTCVALALRALGVPVTVADAIGDDEAGRRVAAAFADRSPLRHRRPHRCSRPCSTPAPRPWAWQNCSSSTRTTPG